MFVDSEATQNRSTYPGSAELVFPHLSGYPALDADAMFSSAEEKSLHLVMGLIKADRYGISVPPS